MKTALKTLEQELNANKAALAQNEMAKGELLRNLNIDKIDTEGDEFADKYTAIQNRTPSSKAQSATSSKPFSISNEQCIQAIIHNNANHLLYLLNKR